MNDANSMEYVLAAKESISATVEQVKKSLDSLPASGGAVQGMFDKLGLTSLSFTGIVGGLSAGLGALGLGAAMSSATDKTAEFGGEVLKLQRMTGMTAESASELIAVAQHVGVSFDTLQGMVAMVERNLGRVIVAQDAGTASTGRAAVSLAEFGIQVRNADGTTKSFSEVFDLIRTKMQNTTDETQRMAIATQIFRNNAAELMPLLTMSSEQYQALAEDAKKYGLILSQDNVNSIREYTLAHRELDEALQGLKIALGMGLIPMLAEAAKAIASGIGGIREFAGDVGDFLNLFQQHGPAALLFWPSLKKSQQDAKDRQAELNQKSSEYLKFFTDLGIKETDFGKATAQFNALMAAGVIVMDQETRQWVNLDLVRQAAQAKQLKALTDEMALDKERLKTLEANSAYEKELLTAKYNAGKISAEQYRDALQTIDNEIFKSKRDEIDKEIAAEKLRPTADPVKTANLLEQQNQLIANYLNAKAKAEDKANQDALKRQDEFNKLKLDALKRQNDLEAALDEIALKNGDLRQTEYLQRQLDRYATETAAKISAVQAAMDSLLAQGYTSDSLAYQKAVQEKEKLQTDLEIKIIQSEEKITEAQQAEDDKRAADFAAALAKEEAHLNEWAVAAKSSFDNVIAPMTIRFQDASDAAFVYYQTMRTLFTEWSISSQGLIPLLNNAEAKFTEVHAKLLQQIDETVNGAKDAYAVLKATGIDTAGQAVGLMTQMENMARESMSTLWEWMQTTGKTIAGSVGMTVDEWVNQVAQYVQHVKDLLTSLQDQILSYQDELDQLRGNDMAILDRWYAEEKKKLKDKFGDDLANTKEYYDAMALLDQLYAEKKKKLLEQMALDQQNATGTGQGTGTGSNGPGGVNQVTPGSSGGNSGGGPYLNLPGYAQMIKENVQSGLSASIAAMAQSLGGDILGTSAMQGEKKMSIDAKVQFDMRDKQGTERWFEDDFWPLFKRKMELMGAKLS